jgi:hypothetical protein
MRGRIGGRGAHFAHPVRVRCRTVSRTADQMTHLHSGLRRTRHPLFSCMGNEMASAGSSKFTELVKKEVTDNKVVVFS